MVDYNDDVVEEEEVGTKEDNFELIFSEFNKNSPAQSFTWCVREKALQRMKEKKVEFPFLLVLVFRKDKTENKYVDYDRFLYPLDQGWGHFEFNQPGEYSIFASVVWANSCFSSKESRRELHSTLLARTSNRYHTSMHDGENFKTFLFNSANSLPFHDRIDVLVDENLFAPEPPEWLRKWANLFFDGEKPKNQCQWRRRLLFAFSIQPFLFIALLCLGYAVFSIIVCGYLLKGYRPSKIGWEAFTDPLHARLSDLGSDNERCYWWKTKKDGSERSGLEKFFLCPITCYVSVFILLIIAAFNPLTSELQVSQVILLSFITFCLISSAAIMVNSACLKRHAVSPDEAEKIRIMQAEKRRKEEQARLQFFYDQRLMPLSCVRRTHESGLPAVPKSHRTLHLRFTELKMKVCKPFRT